MEKYAWLVYLVALLIVFCVLVWVGTLEVANVITKDLGMYLGMVITAIIAIAKGSGNESSNKGDKS